MFINFNNYIFIMLMKYVKTKKTKKKLKKILTHIFILDILVRTS